MVPDDLFDHLLVQLSGAELKVLLYIIRRTFGFKKASDNISISQMLHGIRTSAGESLDRGAGLTKKTLLGALRALEDMRVIHAERRQSAERGNEATCYRLHLEGSAASKPETAPLGEKLPQGGGGETTPSPWGKNYTTQETESQETEEHHQSPAGEPSGGDGSGDVVDLLLERRVSRGAAVALAATYDSDRIRRKCEIHDFLASTGSPLLKTNPAGWLRRAIEDDYPAPTEFTAARRQKERAHTRQALAEAQEAAQLSEQARLMRVPPARRALRELVALENMRAKVGKRPLTKAERAARLASLTRKFTAAQSAFFASHPGSLPVGARHQSRQPAWKGGHD